jgi:hypothetical protein
MEQFQRFEEEQQIQTYQQPVGFNPVRSVSQGGAIRQQYSQYQQSQQFYNQSLDARAAIRQSNTEQANANFANNTSNFVLDKLSELAPTLGKMYQEERDRQNKAAEIEGANNEWQQVYDNGFTDEQRAEEATVLGAESQGNQTFAAATTDAQQTTGSSEIARITAEKNP